MSSFVKCSLNNVSSLSDKTSNKQDSYSSVYSTDNESIDTNVDNMANSVLTINTYLRLRPNDVKEQSTESDDVFKIMDPTTLIVKFPQNDLFKYTRTRTFSKIAPKKYSFTKVFDHTVNQKDFFEQSIKQIIFSFLSGQSSTIMTYGTTDSGKTYTMVGDASSPGIVIRSLELIFTAINCTLHPWYKITDNNTVTNLDETARLLETQVKNTFFNLNSMDDGQCANVRRSLKNAESDVGTSLAADEYNGVSLCSVWLSYMEIYNENIYDLLVNDERDKNSSLKLINDKNGIPCVKDLTMVYANTAYEACQVFLAGQSRAVVRTTSLNTQSSRSHTIFTVKLLKYKKEHIPDDVDVTTLTFCDMAGSGRSKKVYETSKRLAEAVNINNSVMVLNRCLKAVHRGQVMKTKIRGPFRESKLTRIFEKALTGREIMSIIANVNPSSELYVETQGVLASCAIAKKIVTNSTNSEIRNQYESVVRYLENLNSFEKEKTLKNEQVSEDIHDSNQIIHEHRHMSDINATEVAKNIIDVILDVAVVKNYKSAFEQYQSIEVQTEINSNSDEYIIELLKEIEHLKSNALNRELEIREEMANECTKIIENLENNWKKRSIECEEKGRDLLKWSVNQVENFYKERIDNLFYSRKRRKVDNAENAEYNIEIQYLNNENIQITSKVVALREKIEELSAENELLKIDKNKYNFELALVKEQLSAIKNSVIQHTNQNYDEQLKTAMKEKSNTTNNMQLELNTYDKKSKKEKMVERNSLNLSDLDETYFSENADSSFRTNTNDSGITVDFSYTAHRKNCKENKVVEKETQTDAVEKNEKCILQKMMDQLNLDYSNLKSQYDQEILRVNVLLEELNNKKILIRTLTKSNELQEKSIEECENKLRIQQQELDRVSEEKGELTIMYHELSKTMERKSYDYEKKINEVTNRLIIREESECRITKCLEQYIEKCTRLESQLSMLNARKECLLNNCASEHLPKIEELEKDLSAKNVELNVLKEKIGERERDLIRVYELNNKVNEFERVLEKSHREKTEFQCQLHGYLKSLSNVEKKMKDFLKKIVDNDNDMMSLKFEICNIENINSLDRQKINELDKHVVDMLQMIVIFKEELNRSEGYKKNAEISSKAEISSLKSRLAVFEANASVCDLLRNKNSCTQIEIDRLKSQLDEKDIEMRLFEENRNAMIQKYEELVKQLQHDIRANKTEYDRRLQLLMYNLSDQKINNQQIQNSEIVISRTHTLSQNFDTESQTRVRKLFEKVNSCRLKKYEKIKIESASASERSYFESHNCFDKVSLDSAEGQTIANSNSISIETLGKKKRVNDELELKPRKSSTHLSLNKDCEIM